MNKLNDIAKMNRSAENTATVHMRDRCASHKKIPNTILDRKI